MLLPLAAALGLLASAATGLKIPFPCAGRPRGFFPFPGSPCSMYYFACKRAGVGQGIKLACPRGQFFNPASNGCSPPGQIPGCASVFGLPSPQAQPRAPPPPPTSFVRRNPIPRPAPPPPPPPKFIPASPPAPPPPKFAPPPPPPQRQPQSFGLSRYSPPAAPPPPPPSPVVSYGRPAVQAAPPASAGPFDCFGLASGDYAKGCSNIYYSCVGNVATEKACPLPALKFDQDADACLLAEEVRACGGSPKPPTTASPGFAPVEKDPRCAGKTSGIFEMPGHACSSKFLSCNNGFGTEMDCAAGMKFDVGTGMCQGAMYVQACGGVPTPKPTTPLPSTQAPMDPSFVCDGKPDGDYAHPKIQCAYGYYSCVGGSPIPRICPSQALRFDPAQGRCEEQQYNTQCGGAPRQEDPTTTHAPFVTDAEFSCLDKADGLYDDHYGCSATFYACSGGMPSKFKCQGDMAFDLPSKKCQEKPYVTACGGSPTPEPVFNDGPTPLPPPDIDFDCITNGEGPHSLGCSNEWVVCSFGRPYRRTCSAPGLKYDSSIDQCQSSSVVAECGGVPTPKPTPAPPAPQPLPVAFDCSTKTDGIYPDDRQPCSPHFYTCSAGIAAQIKCPTGLFYDQSEKACKTARATPACKARQSSPPVKALPRRGYGYAPLPQAAPPPPPAVPRRTYQAPPPPQAAPPPPPPPPSFIPRPPPPKTFARRQFQPAPAPAPKPRLIQLQPRRPAQFRPINGY